MNYTKRAFIFSAFLVFVLTVHQSLAQISITYPNSRAVFQRNNENFATIYFGGSFGTFLDRIDARLIPINGGALRDWVTIDAAPKQGIYSGSLVAPGGWYQLEVRGVYNSQTVATAVLAKVGVGEVFVILGQSNAQGYRNSGEIGATDDRVNSAANFFNYEPVDLSFPQFGQLEASSTISPGGQGAWYWGELGDNLTRRLNVPVLFMNAAREAMGIRSFLRSMDGREGYNPFSGALLGFGFPYNLFKYTMQQWTNMLGVRAVLYHQGESDNVEGVSREEYYSGLQRMIATSRQQTGKNLSWVVSRASYYPSKGISAAIIGGQNDVIGSVPNTFAGPETDGVRERADGVHFSGNGLRQVAAAWNASLNDSFFANSVPHLAAPPLSVQTTCSGQDWPVEATVLGNYSGYRWTTGSTSPTARLTNGQFQARATDGLQNTQFSIPLQYDNLIPPKPSVWTDGPADFCDGKSVTLRSGTADRLVWSTGERTQSITADKSGIYTASVSNVYGCMNSSDPITVTKRPNPTPVITPDFDLKACTLNPIGLASNYTTGNFWTTGETSQTITAIGKKEISLRVVSEFGCEGTSEKVVINTRTPAEKPSVKLIGKNEFCADTSARLEAITPYNQLAWNTGNTQNAITVRNTGDYTLTVTNSEGCTATSDAVPIVVSPLPAKPSLVASGPTTICSDKQVTLTGTSNTGSTYIWNSGQTTRSITPTRSGQYSVKAVSPKGCFSPSSEIISVGIYDVPETPAIQQVGTYTLEANVANAATNTYKWIKDTSPLPTTTDLLKTTSPGVYTVKAARTYTLQNNGTITCESGLSENYNFSIIGDLQPYIVFPNPVVSSKFYIETLELVGDVTVRIVDPTGKIMKEFTRQKLDVREGFDISDVPKGFYLVSIRSSSIRGAKRILHDN